ncbi:SH3 domain-containing protein [Tessaracoccus caeni]|uniref:SH3 domain-containing protein n=1 Tax=Tessaracoccus caeni TaxID=3031239 RepID=UPI0023DB2E61|nr:SH3 domain-containing protein [Tessaracoccus caeni]MDF1487115.1 SH3 domain-containing protein [Tessaracoccus caeni]
MRAVRSLRACGAAAGLALLLQTTGSLVLGPLADADTTMTATTRVHVRSEPSTSAKSLTILSSGEEVTAGRTSDDGWTEVTYQGQKAYVFGKYLSGKTTSAPVQDSGATGTAYTTGTLNVRTGPGTSYSKVGTAAKGTALTLTGKISGNFTQILWRDKEHWVASSYLSESKPSNPATLPKVTSKGKATTALMIRTTSTSSFQSLGDVPRNTILDLTGKVENGMAQVIWEGNVHWVNNRYLTAVEEDSTPEAPSSQPKTSTRYATADLNVWAKSSGLSHSTEIPRGSKIQVTGTIENGRAEIIHNGARRWVTSRYTSTTKPTTTPPAAGGGLVKGPSSTTDRANINKGYSSGLDKVNDDAKRIAWYVWDNYPAIRTMYGWRRDVTPDHPAGRAIDVMIPNYRKDNRVGDEIAQFFRDNAKEFGVSYIIWDQKIWSVARNSEGWRHMASRGGDTANHKDHVHINTY